MSSQPPNQFQVELPVPDSSKASANQLSKKCRLCRVERRKFICKNCLTKGNWIQTTINDSER